MIGYNSVVLAFQIEQGGCAIAYASHILMEMLAVNILEVLISYTAYWSSWITLLNGLVQFHSVTKQQFQSVMLSSSHVVVFE